MSTIFFFPQYMRDLHQMMERPKLVPGPGEGKLLLFAHPTPAGDTSSRWQPRSHLDRPGEWRST